MNICIVLIFLCVSGINCSFTTQGQNGTTVASEKTSRTATTLATSKTATTFATSEGLKLTSEIRGNFTTRSALYLRGEGDYASRNRRK